MPIINHFIKATVLGSLLAVAHYANASESVTDGVQLVDDARKQIGVTVSYDPSYRRLDFPGGDVPESTGVCTDVIIRAYRKQGIDLQQLVNADMKSHFSAYPNVWGLTRTDSNIDHRRVPNLETFFKRHAQVLSTTDKSSFRAGDIVTWRLPESNLPHIGIVSDKTAEDGTPLIIHNIGRGTKEENILFLFDIHSHFAISQPYIVRQMACAAGWHKTPSLRCAGS